MSSCSKPLLGKERGEREGRRERGEGRGGKEEGGRKRRVGEEKGEEKRSGGVAKGVREEKEKTVMKQG